MLPPSTSSSTIYSSLGAALPPLPATPGSLLRPLIEDDFAGALRFQYGRSKEMKDKGTREREREIIDASLSER